MESIFGWLLNIVLLLSVLFILGYQLLCLADLELDYVNPYDSASRINTVVFPEYLTQGVLCLAFLLTGHWFFCLLSLPYLYYNVKLYMQRRHLIDVTEIYNQMQWEKKLRIFKIGYLVLVLTLCIFWMLWTIVDESD